MKRYFGIIILFGFLLFSLLFTSCNKIDLNTFVYAPTDNVYHCEYIRLPDNYIAYADTLQVMNNRVWLLVSDNTLGAKTTETVNRLLSFNLEGKDMREETIYGKHDTPDSNIAILAVDEESGLVYTENYSDGENGYRTVITRTDAEGNILFSNDFEAMTADEDREILFNATGGGTTVNINSIAVGGNGNIYAGTDLSVIAFDEKGNMLYEAKMDGTRVSVGSTPDGRIFVAYTESGLYGGLKAVYLDDEKMSAGDEVPSPEITTVNMKYNLLAGTGYDSYLTNLKGLYGYNAGDTDPTLLCSWLNSDVTSNYAENIVIASPELFYTIIPKSIFNPAVYELCIMTAVPPEEVAPKKLITLAYNNSNLYIENAIVDFNRSSDEYRILTKNYFEYATLENFDLALDAMTADIITGKNVPDIILLSEYVDYENYLNKGLFYDLYKLMDADDNFDKSNLFKCVLTPFEENGALYKLATSFRVITLAGSSQDFTGRTGTGRTGWTMNEFLDRAESLENGQILLMNEGISHISTLQSLCSYCLGSFIDYSAGTCTFDSELFIRFLKYIKNLPEKRYEDTLNADAIIAFNSDRNMVYRDGTVLLKPVAIFNFASLTTARIAFDGEPAYIGYPNGSENGTMVSAQTCYTITSASAVKEGSWEFIKLLLSDKYRLDNGYKGVNIDFPSTRSAAKVLIENEKKYYYTVTGQNTDWPTKRPVTDSEYDDASSDSITKTDTGWEFRLIQSDIDATLAIFDSITTAVWDTRNSDVFDIITEEADIYFNGVKTAEETAKIIQNRISIYLSELK